MTSRKYPSIEALVENSQTALREGDLEGPLRTVYDVVDRILTEPLCTAQVYGSRKLDHLCQEIGRANFAKLNLSPSKSRTEKTTWVFIVTKLQNSGGHTRVMQDFIKTKPDARHVFLSTDLNGRSNLTNLMPDELKSFDIAFESAPRGPYVGKLSWLQTRLVETAPTRVFLFNDHADSVAVAALQPKMNLDAYFYHHADHHLCLGLFLPHVKHIDTHPTGYHQCREVLGLENLYLPLTVEDHGARSNENFLAGGKLTTCTAGRSNKLEIPYFFSYLDLVGDILKTTGGIHIHIGKLSPWGLSRIRRGLAKHGIACEKFVYIPWVRSVWKTLQERRVDLYIASFPYGGGLTMLEAMGAGVPVALHRHVFSRVLGAVDLGYEGAFSWRWPRELLTFLSSLNADPRASESLAEDGRRGRERYVTLHSGSKLAKAMASPTLEGAKPPEALTRYPIESDEHALWMEQRVSFGHLCARWIYRTLRRIRAWWW